MAAPVLALLAAPLVATSTLALWVPAITTPLDSDETPVPEAGRAFLWRPEVALRVSAGTEWDSNAERVPTQEASATPDGDAVLRLLADVRARLLVTPRDALTVRYVAGMKRFFALDPEDLLVHDLDGTATVGLFQGLDVSLRGRYRASRIRNRTRDYTLASAGGSASWRPIELLRVSAEGRFDALDFPPTCLLSYTGPAARGGVDLYPIEGLELGASGGASWRIYEGRFDPQSGFGVTLCNSGLDRRRDAEPWASVHGAYRGAFMVGGELTARFSDSNDPYETIDRYRASAWATIPLPFELVLNVLGALQFNRGTSVSQSLRAVEDDENQNSFEAQLIRPLAGGLEVSARYAVYANEFATAPAAFVRHTFYLGLSFETEAQ